MSDPRYTDPRYSDPRRPVEPNAPRRRMDIEDGSGAMWGWVAAIAAIVVVIALMVGYHRMDLNRRRTGRSIRRPRPALPRRRPPRQLRCRHIRRPRQFRRPFSRPRHLPHRLRRPTRRTNVGSGRGALAAQRERRSPRFGVRVFGAAHTGRLSCFFAGISTFLSRSMASARVNRRRVARGMITSSM